MPKKQILPTIEAVYDSDGLAFFCDGEPIEDMEFTWEDLSDGELVAEVAEELAEYIDSSELEDIDNPVKAVSRAIRQLRKSKVAAKALEEDADEGLDSDGDDELDEDYEEEDDE